MNTILEIDSLAELIAKEKSAGSRIVLCHGIFDLVHIGHIRYLQAAKKMGDILVVTITPDRFVAQGPGRPAFPDRLRN